jgi:hypothetical protein
MKRGSEKALEKLMRLFSSKMGKRELAEGVWGYLYPHSQKLAVDERVSGYSGYMSGYFRHCPRIFRTETRRSAVGER